MRSTEAISGSGEHTSSALALFPSDSLSEKTFSQCESVAIPVSMSCLEKAALALVRDMHGPFEEMQLYGAWLALPVFSERRLWTATSTSERAQQ